MKFDIAKAVNLCMVVRILRKLDYLEVESIHGSFQISFFYPIGKGPG